MQDCVKEVRDLESSYEDINALIELTEEEEDREMIKEIQREIAKFEKEFEDGGINFDIFSLISYIRIYEDTQDYRANLELLLQVNLVKLVFLKNPLKPLQNNV